MKHFNAVRSLYEDDYTATEFDEFLEEEEILDDFRQELVDQGCPEDEITEEILECIDSLERDHELRFA